MPAVPQPLGRHRGVRPRRRAVRQRRRRRQLQLRRLRPGRRAGQPVRRPAWRCRRDAHPADRRGWCAAQPGPPHRRRPGRPWTARSSGSTRPRAPRCRTTRWPAPPTPTRGASSPTACATRSASPSGQEPTRSGSATSAGTTGRRSTASPTAPARWRTSAGPATRAAAGKSGYDGANLNICENLYAAARGGHRAVLRLPPQQPGRADESLPHRQLLHRRVEFEFAAAQNSYPAEYDGALFFADYSRDCIWVMPKGADGQPAPGQVRTFVAGAANPVNLENGPGRRPVLRRLRRRHDPAHQLHQRQPAADRRRHGHPDHRRRRSPSASTAAAPATPTRRHADLRLGPRRRRRVRRLDRRQADVHLHHAAARYTATLRVTDSSGRLGTAIVTITVGNTPPTAVDQHPGGGHHLEGRRRHQLLRARPPTPRTAPCRPRPDLGAGHAALPVQLPRAPDADFAGVAAGSFTAPDHEYPSYLELRLTATDSGGLTRHQDAAARSADRGADLPDDPGWAAAAVGGTIAKASFRSDRDRRVDQHGQCLLAPDQGCEDLHLRSWSDGGAQTHNIVAPATARRTPPGSDSRAGTGRVRAPVSGERARGRRRGPGCWRAAW